MRGRMLAVALAGALGVGAATQTSLVELPQRLIAPAYDTVTQANLRNMAVALHSYALFEGGLDDATEEELVGYGWSRSETTAVRVEVHGTQFRVVAWDVRPGAGAFEVSGTDDDAGLRMARVDCAEVVGCGGAAAGGDGAGGDGVGEVTFVVVPGW